MVQTKRLITSSTILPHLLSSQIKILFILQSYKSCYRHFSLIIVHHSIKYNHGTDKTVNHELPPNSHYGTATKPKSCSSYNPVNPPILKILLPTIFTNHGSSFNHKKIMGSDHTPPPPQPQYSNPDHPPILKILMLTNSSTPQQRLFEE